MEVAPDTRPEILLGNPDYLYPWQRKEWYAL
jgi:hypothetical protein